VRPSVASCFPVVPPALFVVAVGVSTRVVRQVRRGRGTVSVPRCYVVLSLPDGERMRFAALAVSRGTFRSLRAYGARLLTRCEGVHAMRKAVRP
jgi:hypothetical protein